ncbi:MAG TPA: hypothetical protein EYG11_01380 [Candidatus Latescibacteria bacterium]|nr:hypothetical protein [Candidatus Handelsmanbacteria bacterium]HIL07326.1 hypothetical protein [Candidatus Latescibacterota bacterium]
MRSLKKQATTPAPPERPRRPMRCPSARTPAAFAIAAAGSICILSTTLARTAPTSSAGITPLITHRIQVVENLISLH